MSADFPMLDPPWHVANYCDRKGAEELKAKIEAHWASRGESVTVWVEQNGFSPAMRGAYWVVRSDLVGGLPRSPAVEDRRAA